MGNVFLTDRSVMATRTVRLAWTRPSVGRALKAPNQTLSAATETSSVATSTVTA